MESLFDVRVGFAMSAKAICNKNKYLTVDGKQEIFIQSWTGRSKDEDNYKGALTVADFIRSFLIVFIVLRWRARVVHPPPSFRPPATG